MLGPNSSGTYIFVPNMGYFSVGITQYHSMVFNHVGVFAGSEFFWKLGNWNRSLISRALSTSRRDVYIYGCISICGPGTYNSHALGYLNDRELGLEDGENYVYKDNF